MNAKSEKISFLLLLPTLESFHTVHPICFRKASGPALAVSSRIRLLATSRVMYSSSSSSLRRISSSRVGSVLCMATCTSYVVVAVGAVGSGGGRFERTEYKVDVGRRSKRESINYSRQTLIRSRKIIISNYSPPFENVVGDAALCISAVVRHISSHHHYGEVSKEGRKQRPSIRTSYLFAKRFIIVWSVWTYLSHFSVFS